MILGPMAKHCVDVPFYRAGITKPFYILHGMSWEDELASGKL